MIAREDVLITFRYRGVICGQLRVASRGGTDTAEAVKTAFPEMLKKDYTVEVEVISPSRFTPEDIE